MAVAFLLIAVIIAVLVGIVFKIKSSGLPDAAEEVCFNGFEHQYDHILLRWLFYSFTLRVDYFDHFRRQSKFFPLFLFAACRCFWRPWCQRSESHASWT
jgi:hypothetical protein